MSTAIAVDAVGWVGAASLLLAYGLVSAGRLAPGGWRFQALNLLGACFLAVNGAYHGAWPSVGLNGVWLVIGAAAIVRARRGARPSVPGPRVMPPTTASS